MWSRPLPILSALLIAGTAPAAAEGFRVAAPYGAFHGTDSYGYAGAFVRGTYVGAPLTRFSRPTEIVPTPWSYGTYGVPTVSGLPPAPTGQPTLTVVNGGAARRGEAGVRVIEVRVPRR